jgi:hypothetical protein
VILKGNFKLEEWNPHTGQFSECTATPEIKNATKFTRMQLRLEPEKNVFWVGK